MKIMKGVKELFLPPDSVTSSLAVFYVPMIILPDEMKHVVTGSQAIVEKFMKYMLQQYIFNNKIEEKISNFCLIILKFGY